MISTKTQVKHMTLSESLTVEANGLHKPNKMGPYQL